MQIKDYCTKNVQYVTPETSVVEVARLMQKHDCGSILVEEDEKLTGVITDRDIVLRCVAQNKDPEEMRAEECQTEKVLYCYETDEPKDIIENMAENKVRRMVVLDNDENKKLVGIISFGDLSAICEDNEAVGEAMEKIRKAA